VSKEPRARQFVSRWERKPLAGRWITLEKPDPHQAARRRLKAESGFADATPPCQTPPPRHYRCPAFYSMSLTAKLIPTGLRPIFDKVLAAERITRCGKR